MFQPAVPMLAVAAKCPSGNGPAIPQAATSPMKVIAAASMKRPTRSGRGAAAG